MPEQPHVEPRSTGSYRLTFGPLRHVILVVLLAFALLMAQGTIESGQGDDRRVEPAWVSWLIGLLIAVPTLAWYRFMAPAVFDAATRTVTLPPRFPWSRGPRRFAFDLFDQVQIKRTLRRRGKGPPTAGGQRAYVVYAVKLGRPGTSSLWLRESPQYLAERRRGEAIAGVMRLPLVDAGEHTHTHRSPEELDRAYVSRIRSGALARPGSKHAAAAMPAGGAREDKARRTRRAGRPPADTPAAVAAQPGLIRAQRIGPAIEFELPPIRMGGWVSQLLFELFLIAAGLAAFWTIGTMFLPAVTPWVLGTALLAIVLKNIAYFGEREIVLASPEELRVTRRYCWITHVEQIAIDELEELLDLTYHPTSLLARSDRRIIRFGRELTRGERAWLHGAVTDALLGETRA